MKQFYTCCVIFLLFIFSFFHSRAQVGWQKGNGQTGSGSFTISGSGSVSTLNSTADIAFLKHGSGSDTYYTCDHCVINIQVSGQFVIDYPLYLTNSAVNVGISAVSTANNTASLYISGNSQNAKQGLYLDNASTIQLESPTNFIELQNAPVAYVYYDYSGTADAIVPAGSKYYLGSNNGPLCGLSVPNGTTYTCNDGQVNGPSILNASGFSVAAPLPVVLVNFSASLNSNNTIELNWSTQMEQDLNEFVVNRSADGSNWEEIGTVKANGNSGTISNYSYTDEQPLSGLNYYRLLMTDLSGRTGYTQIQWVRTSINKPFTIFPNPSRDYVDITLNKVTTGSLLLLNPFGQLLQQQPLSASSTGTTLSFQLSGYPAGYYIVEVVGTDGSKETGKLLIVR